LKKGQAIVEATLVKMAIHQGATLVKNGKSIKIHIQSHQQQPETYYH
jgi:hypothetical protein